MYPMGFRAALQLLALALSLQALSRSTDQGSRGCLKCMSGRRFATHVPNLWHCGCELALVEAGALAVSALCARVSSRFPRTSTARLDRRARRAGGRGRTVRRLRVLSSRCAGRRAAPGRLFWPVRGADRFAAWPWGCIFGVAATFHAILTLLRWLLALLSDLRNARVLAGTRIVGDRGIPCAERKEIVVFCRLVPLCSGSFRRQAALSALA
nr:hypothetical protein Iba_chr09bCG0650 [Ipomoea batatas]